MGQAETKRTNQINILAALIIVMSLIIIALSASYAFFMNVVKENEEHKDNKGVNITSGELTMTFATTDEQYINNDSADLLSDSDVLSKGDYTEFSVTLPDSSTVDAASYFFYLTDVEITENFKNEDVKWALFKNGTSSPSSLDEAVAKGSFKDIVLSENGETGTDGNRKKANDYSLMYKDGTQQNNFTIKRSSNESVTESYKLYVWLSNDPENNQKELLNGSLSAKVAFKAVSTIEE